VSRDRPASSSGHSPNVILWRRFVEPLLSDRFAFLLTAALCAVTAVAGGGMRLGATTSTEMGMLIASGAVVAAAFVAAPAPRRLYGALPVAGMLVLTAIAAWSITWAINPSDAWIDANRHLAYLAASAYGQEQVRQSVEEIKRAADAGIRSVLIADIGVLSLFGRLREAEVLPGDMQAKVSASFPVTNASTAALLEQLGANTLNLAPDLTLAQIASVRAAVAIPVDIYVEGPDLTGGIVRLHEIDEIVRVAAPVYVKFGLRNAPDIYPSGTHLERTGIELSRERVRRAQIGVEAIRRTFPDEPASLPGAPDLAIPVEP